MTKFYLLTFSSLLFIYSCKTASKAYQKGDYTSAIELGVKKLQKDPSDAETRNLLKNSYTYEVNQHEEDIRTLSASQSELRFEKIYQEYGHLQHLYEIIRQYPEANKFLKPTNYAQNLETIGGQAAAVHAQKGDQWMNEGTKQAFREAFKEYDIAVSFSPEDPELRNRRDDAYEAALTRVVISPIQDPGGYSYASTSRLQNFQNDIIRTLANNLNDGFVKFYNEFQARSENIVPDQIMELNLSRISLAMPHDEKSTKEVSKQVVTKEIVYSKDSVVNQYGTVRANVITTTRTYLSQADLFITIRDGQGRVIWNDRFTGESRKDIKMYSYTGDERALSSDDKKLLDQKVEVYGSNEQAFDDLLLQIRNDLSYRMRSHYR
ncbi:MAG TPA: hypothetical protein VNS32_28915 [Flavisolibacter sp.]|nr:hypothetical protein [Flavisolibacter sp.]